MYISDIAVQFNQVHQKLFTNVNLRFVHTAVVENKTGICKCQAGLLRLEIELHNLVVTCTKKIPVKVKGLIHDRRNFQMALSFHSYIFI